ncbi:MAG: hypothetical protein ACFB51_20265 [Anaerolineae bacterium]
MQPNKIEARMMQVTGAGRILHPAYPSHRLMAGLAAIFAVVGGVVGLVTGRTLLQVAVLAAGAAIGSAGGWMLAREADPDRHLTATLAAVFGGVLAVILPPISLFLVGASVLSLRAANRTTGVPFKLSDTVGFLVVAALTIFTVGQPLLGVPIAAALLLDGVLVRPNRAHLAAMAVAVLATAFALITGWQMPLAVGDLRVEDSGLVWLAPLLLVVVFQLLIPATAEPQSPPDAPNGEPLARARIVAARVVLLLVALVSLAYGRAGISASGPVWAALLAVIIGQVSSPYLLPSDRAAKPR